MLEGRGRLLFVLDLANNHMGQVEHGVRIIRDAADLIRDFSEFDFAVKFQYRQLDTFIHPDCRTRTDYKYVKRFQETRLSWQDYRAMKIEAARHGFITICTPFDEASVDRIVEHGFPVIKVASCSFTDWPLLEKIVQTDKPIIASTGGASLEEIDQVVSFFDNRSKPFALMHCVSEYPTSDDALQLNQIDLLKNRYPSVRIGFSTHEIPDHVDPVKVAVAKGATILEKHVGVPTDAIALNAYSATPAQLRRWVEAAASAAQMCGLVGMRAEPSQGEHASLVGLRRGVFARRALGAGQRVVDQDVFFAIPLLEGQITANDWSKYTSFETLQPVAANGPLLATNMKRIDTRAKVRQIVDQVKDLLARSGVAAPGKAGLEISHHYGLDRFEEYGLTMITVVNRSYCKKLLIMLPGQSHPEQFHKIKEETFHVLYGDVHAKLDGTLHALQRGDVLVVEPGVRHEFNAPTGAVIEEISSTHHTDDSFYTDPAIHNNPARKTYLTHWIV